MSTAFDYMKATQNFLRDANQATFDPANLINYVNRARREVAGRSHCIRIVPPTSGPIGSATVVTGGTGYTAPTVSITAPDSPGGQVINPAGAQATGTATAFGGVITSVDITYGGDGYFQPLITINDPTGTGAQVTPVIPHTLTANPSQEIYAFSDVDLSTFPGVGSIYAVRSVSFIYAGSRYSALIYSFSQYQAFIRQYAPGYYYYTPCMGAQVGRGTAGKFYVYPPPSQVLRMEWDCSCLPSDLTLSSGTNECPIPEPYTDAVPYYAAHLAYLELQNLNSARAYLELYEKRMIDFGGNTLPGRAISPYGRPGG